MSDGPGRLSLEAEVAADRIGDAVAAVMAACRRARAFSQLRGWRDGEAGPLIADGLPAHEDMAATIEFSSETEYGLVIPAGQSHRYTFTLSWLGTTGASEILAGMSAILTDLAAAARLRQALVRRLIGGHCLPALKLAESATHLLACTADQVEEAYTDVPRFVEAWDTIERHGAIAIHARALNDTENPDFLRHVLPGHMAMARIARPGCIEFYSPRFADGEFDVLNAGEPTLTGIGYHPTEQIYEFAGQIPPGAELRCIDLLTAWRIASDRRLEDGRPVREVRAVFMDAGQASRAAPLLQAAGVHTWWEDERGQLRRLRG